MQDVDASLPMDGGRSAPQAPGIPMFAVISFEVSGSLSHYVGNRDDCKLWRLMQTSNASRALYRRAHGSDWSPRIVSDVLPKDEFERKLSESIGCSVTLQASPVLPSWQAYGFRGEDAAQAPTLVPLGAANPNPTGHSTDVLRASAGVGPDSVVGTLAADWRTHRKGALAVITVHARDVTALYIRVEP